MTDRPSDQPAPAPSAPAGDGRPRVVVGVDGSAGARSALRTALLEAGRRQARLDVVAAYPVVYSWTGGMPVDVPDLPRVRVDTRDRARGFLDEVRAELVAEEMPSLADLPVHLVVTGGPAAAVLTHRAEGADLLVVGSRGRGEMRSALLGSVALHCVTHAPCPVMVVHGVPDARAARPGRVVAGLDGSDTSVAALREVVGEAGRRGADLEVVVAYSVADLWTDPSSTARPTLADIRARVREEADRLVTRIAEEQDPGSGPVPHLHVTLVEGIAREALLERAEGADLLVVGSRSSGVLRGVLLGSVALHCVVHAPCTVVVVHPQDRPVPAPRAAEPAGAGR